MRKRSQLKLGNYDCRKYHNSIMSLIGGAREINRAAVDLFSNMENFPQEIPDHSIAISSSLWRRLQMALLLYRRREMPAPILAVATNGILSSLERHSGKKIEVHREVA
jgi:hypothetical protein